MTDVNAVNHRKQKISELTSVSNSSPDCKRPLANQSIQQQSMSNTTIVWHVVWSPIVTVTQAIMFSWERQKIQALHWLFTATVLLWYLTIPTLLLDFLLLPQLLPSTFKASYVGSRTFLMRGSKTKKLSPK